MDNTIVKHLTADEFLAKIEELRTSENTWICNYYVDEAKLRIQELRGDEIFMHYSPILHEMPKHEFDEFKAKLVMFYRPERT